MRHLLLGTVATVAILAAPTGAFAQSQPIQEQSAGQKQAAGGGERAKIDAMLDQAAMPTKSGDAGQRADAADSKQPSERAAATADPSAPAPATTTVAKSMDPAPDAATARMPEKSAARADDQDKSTDLSAERTTGTRDAAPRVTAQQTSTQTKGDRLAARDDRQVSDRKAARPAEVERARVRPASSRVDVDAGRSRADRRVDVEASDRVRSVAPRRTDRRVDVAASVRNDRVGRAEPRRAARERIARGAPRGPRFDDRRRFDDQRVADRMEAPRMAEGRRSARRFVEAAPNPGAARILEMGDGRVLIVRPRIAYRTYRVVTVVEE